MFKLIGLLIIFTSFALAGYASFYKFFEKVNFLEQYIAFIKYIEVNIQYCENLVYEIVSKYNPQNNLLKKFLCEYINNIKRKDTSEAAFSKALNIIAISKILNKDEINLISNFNSCLGSSDVLNQVKQCKLAEHLLKEKLKIAISEKENKSKVILLMYISAGLLVILILL